MNDFIEVIIKKPLYLYQNTPFVNVRDKYIRQAIKEMKLLKIKCLGRIHYCTGQEWKEKGKRVEEVFNFPNRPMVLYGGYVVNNLPPERPEVNMDNYLDNMCQLGKIFRKILKKRGY
jgi:hypothetical protein